MLIVSWNCRGLGNPNKAKAVKDLLKLNSTDILMLQETKIDDEALLFLSRTKWKLNDGIAVSSCGSSGGLETLWYEEKFHLKNSFVSHHWIFIKIQHNSSKIQLALFNLYVPVSFIKKRECWNSLSDFLETSSPYNLII